VTAQRIGWLLLLLFGVSGCASVNLTAGFPELSAAVEERSATKLVWNRGTDLDKATADQLRSLLQRKLTADDAVQIAMLNNRDLQAMYSELGVAQADLVQAGLFKINSDPRVLPLTESGDSSSASSASGRPHPTPEARAKPSSGGCSRSRGRAGLRRAGATRSTIRR
jgi:hypothetical protein